MNNWDLPGILDTLGISRGLGLFEDPTIKFNVHIAQVPSKIRLSELEFSTMLQVVHHQTRLKKSAVEAK